MTSRGARRHLRRHLIAGLVVIAPVSITAYVLWWIFRTLDSLIGRYIYAAMGITIPGLGLLALLLLLLLVGWVAERALGSRFFQWWNVLVDRLPLVSRIYGASNRIVRTIFGEDRRFFREVVLVQYPTDDRWSLGFLTAEAPAALRARFEDGVTVFIPTTPNPTTGFLVVLPREKVIPAAMSLEDAFTFILSAGAVSPAERPGAPIEVPREVLP